MEQMIIVVDTWLVDDSIHFKVCSKADSCLCADKNDFFETHQHPDYSQFRVRLKLEWKQTWDKENAYITLSSCESRSCAYELIDLPEATWRICNIINHIG